MMAFVFVERTGTTTHVRVNDDCLTALPAAAGAILGRGQATELPCRPHLLPCGGLVTWWRTLLDDGTLLLELLGLLVISTGWLEIASTGSVHLQPARR